MLDSDTIASAGPPRQLSPDIEIDVALLRDPGDRLAPNADLVRSPAFFRLHAPAYQRAWYAVVMDGSSGESLAGGWFAETTPGEACSGVNGPFGGLHSPFSPLPISLAARVVRATEEELRVRQIRRVRITLPPAAYEPDAHAHWMNIFLRFGYTAAPPDIHYHATVGAEPLDERMSAVQCAVVRTAERRGMVARALRPDERADAFTVIATGQLRDGRATGTSLESLLAFEAALPEVVSWHGVFQRDRMIAASCSMSLSQDWSHVHGIGDVSGVERDSPVALLVSHLYAEAAAQGTAVLGIGLASADGEPNEGLISRYRMLGFEPSAQFTVEKALEG